MAKCIETRPTYSKNVICMQLLYSWLSGVSVYCRKLVQNVNTLRENRTYAPYFSTRGIIDTALTRPDFRSSFSGRKASRPWRTPAIIPSPTIAAEQRKRPKALEDINRRLSQASDFCCASFSCHYFATTVVDIILRELFNDAVSFAKKSDILPKHKRQRPKPYNIDCQQSLSGEDKRRFGCNWPSEKEIREIEILGNILAKTRVYIRWILSCWKGSYYDQVSY